ncbi:MAG: lysine biosynthesis enzyme LysX, partial [Thermoproteota archaeon]|nr:lysine biosynthesis enzyme LysX [Thermoproteota archaeon]
MRQEEKKEEGKQASPTPPLNHYNRSIILLYDVIRWEEKALYEAAIKKGIKVENIDCKNLAIDLNDKNSKYREHLVLQRTVSYFKNVHSTAALEGLGARVINSLHTAIMCGNKMYGHMELQKAGIRTPKAVAAFSEQSAMAVLDK